MNRRNLLASLLAAPLALLGIKLKPKPKVMKIDCAVFSINKRGIGGKSGNGNWVRMSAVLDISKDGKITVRQN